MQNTNDSRESVGRAFRAEHMREAQTYAWKVMEEIAAMIEPGMSESDGTRLTRSMLKQRGLLLGWHAVCVRFGCNTTLEYGAPSKPGVILAENDIFTFDIGPLWNGYEADCGSTFVVGSDPDMARAMRDVKLIWERTRDEWRTKGVTGVALYRFAADEAERLGWEFDSVMSGHRVGDFPHRYKGALRTMSDVPSPDIWILETLIRHKSRPFGAYVEDLLN
jgi:methionyl aminopeptidase